jgi:TolA-binding protein
MLGMDTKDIVQLLLTLIAMAMSVAAWLRKPGEDAKESLQKHVTVEHAALREKVSTMEERLKHMPTSDELADLEGNVKRLSGQLDSMLETMRSLQSSQRRIEDYLLNSKG